MGKIHEATVRVGRSVEMCGVCHLVLAPGDERTTKDGMVMHRRHVGKTEVSGKFLGTVYAMQTAIELVSESCWNVADERFAHWAEVLLAEGALKRLFADGRRPIGTETVMAVRRMYQALSGFLRFLPKASAIEVNAGRTILTGAMYQLHKEAKKHFGYQLPLTRSVNDWLEFNRRARLKLRARKQMLQTRTVMMVGAAALA